MNLIKVESATCKFKMIWSDNSIEKRPKEREVRVHNKS
jgi:hypothetical protein